MSVQNFMPILEVVVELFQSGATLSSLTVKKDKQQKRATWTERTDKYRDQI